MLNSYQFNTAQLNNTGSSPVNKNVRTYVLDIRNLATKVETYLFDAWNLATKSVMYVLDIRNLATKALAYVLDVRNLATKTVTYPYRKLMPPGMLAEWMHQFGNL